MDNDNDDDVRITERFVCESNSHVSVFLICVFNPFRNKKHGRENTLKINHKIYFEKNLLKLVAPASSSPRKKNLTLTVLTFRYREIQIKKRRRTVKYCSVVKRFWFGSNLNNLI